MKLYHYTTKKGKDGIMRDEKIDQSTNEIEDCRLGKGVYLTGLDPCSCSKEEISVNNYLSPAKALRGYVDWAIEVDIPSHEVKENGDGRNVYCYQGRDLWLDNYSYRVIKNESPMSQSGLPAEKEESSFINPLNLAAAGGAALLLGYGLKQLLGKKEDTKKIRS